MASTDARPMPRKNTAFRVYLPIWDADGDLVTGAADLDSEVSIDGGTFADCTNEATEVATSSGMLKAIVNLLQGCKPFAKFLPALSHIISYPVVGSDSGRKFKRTLSLLFLDNKKWEEFSQCHFGLIAASCPEKHGTINRLLVLPNSTTKQRLKYSQWPEIGLCRSYIKILAGVFFEMDNRNTALPIKESGCPTKPLLAGKVGRQFGERGRTSDCLNWPVIVTSIVPTGVVRGTESVSFGKFVASINLACSAFSRVIRCAVAILSKVMHLAKTFAKVRSVTISQGACNVFPCGHSISFLVMFGIIPFQYQVSNNG